jgi:hypothetical protein
MIIRKSILSKSICDKTIFLTQSILSKSGNFFSFHACILRYYLPKPLTSLSCSLNAVFPGLKMWDTFACATANLLTHFIISIAVLENESPDAGLQKRATFSTLNVGLAGTGNRTQATCVASSSTNQPIHSMRGFLDCVVCDLTLFYLYGICGKTDIILCNCSKSEKGT